MRKQKPQFSLFDDPTLIVKRPGRIKARVPVKTGEPHVVIRYMDGEDTLHMFTSSRVEAEALAKDLIRDSTERTEVYGQDEYYRIYRDGRFALTAPR